MPKYVTRSGRLTNTHLLAPDGATAESLRTFCGLRLPFEAKAGRLKITQSVPKGKRECERCRAADGRPVPPQVRGSKPMEEHPGWNVLWEESFGTYAIQEDGGAQRWNAGATGQHIRTPGLTFEEYLVVLAATREKVAEVLAKRTR